KELLINYVLVPDDNIDRKIARKLFLNNVIKNGLLDDANTEKIEKLVNELSIKEAFELYPNLELLYDRVIEELTSGIFIQQNDTVSLIFSDNGKKLLNYLNNEKLFDLGKYIYYAAEHGS